MIPCHVVGQWFGRGCYQWLAASCLLVGFACARMFCNSVLSFWSLGILEWLTVCSRPFSAEDDNLLLSCGFPSFNGNVAWFLAS